MSTADDATGATRFEQARTRVLDWSARLKRDFACMCSSSLTGRGSRPARRARAVEADGRGDVADPRDCSLPPRWLRDVMSRPSCSSRTGFTMRRVIRLRRPASSGVVVDAVGVGNSLRSSPSYRDARVADLECPEQLPVNNRAKDHGPSRAVRAGGPGRQGGARTGRQGRRDRPRWSCEMASWTRRSRSSSCPRSRGGTPHRANSAGPR